MVLFKIIASLHNHKHIGFSKLSPKLAHGKLAPLRRKRPLSTVPGPQCLSRPGVPPCFLLPDRQDVGALPVAVVLEGVQLGGDWEGGGGVVRGGGAVRRRGPDADPHHDALLAWEKVSIEPGPH